MPVNPLFPKSVHHIFGLIASAALIASALITMVILQTCKTGDKVVDLGHHALQTTEKIVKVIPDALAKFKTGTISHTFVEENTEVASTMGDVLELASIRQDETFRKEDSLQLLWSTVSLGTTTSEIRVPVVFRYHLRLSDHWQLATKDHICKVIAPPIAATQPPAIFTSGLVKSTAAGWARFNKDQNLDELERSLTPTLQIRAIDRYHQRLAREACRQSVAKFVEKWLIRDEQWSQDQFNAIVVVFPDELGPGAGEDLSQLQHDPTIQLQQKN